MRYDGFSLSSLGVLPFRIPAGGCRTCASMEDVDHLVRLAAFDHADSDPSRVGPPGARAGKLIESAHA